MDQEHERQRPTNQYLLIMVFILWLVGRYPRNGCKRLESDDQHECACRAVKKCLSSCFLLSQKSCLAQELRTSTKWQKDGKEMAENRNPLIINFLPFATFIIVTVGFLKAFLSAMAIASLSSFMSFATVALGPFPGFNRCFGKVLCFYQLRSYLRSPSKTNLKSSG